MNRELESFLKAVIGLGVVALFFVVLTTLAGCDAPIPIDPVCFVPTECVDEVVEEFCTVDDEDSDTDRHRNQRGKGHGKGRGKGHSK